MKLSFQSKIFIDLKNTKINLNYIQLNIYIYLYTVISTLNPLSPNPPLQINFFFNKNINNVIPIFRKYVFIISIIKFDYIIIINKIISISKKIGFIYLRDDFSGYYGISINK